MKLMWKKAIRLLNEKKLSKHLVVTLKQDGFQVIQPHHHMLSQLQKLTQQGTLVTSNVSDGKHITSVHIV